MQVLRKQAARVAILDVDLHHGNGTQALVETDPNIRFLSMHQWPWYPGTGAADDRGPHQNVWNVPMAAGLAREAYVSAFLSAVDAASEGDAGLAARDRHPLKQNGSARA